MNTSGSFLRFTSEIGSVLDCPDSSIYTDIAKCLYIDVSADLV